MKKTSIILTVFVLLLIPVFAIAAGFKIPEQDAKAMGEAFAFTAQADNPSAIYFNPAGLTQLTGTQFRGGATWIMAPGAEFSGIVNFMPETSVTGKDQNFLIPNLYFVTDLNTKDFRFGIGVFSPFGLSRKYEDANAIFKNKEDSAELVTININPTIAYKVNKYLSLAAGVSYLHSDVKLSQTVNISAPAAGTYWPGTDLYKMYSDLHGDGIGFNLGAMVKFDEQLQVGLSYRSRSAVKYKGTNTIDAYTTPVAFLGGKSGSTFFGGATLIGDQVTSKIIFPDNISAGISYKPIKDLTLEVDLKWDNWSTYNKLPMIFTNTNAIYTSKDVEKNWKDAWSVAIGANYKFLKNYAVRGGYEFEKTPVPGHTLGPELPDSNRNKIAFGLGYERNNISADLAYMVLLFRDRKFVSGNEPVLLSAVNNYYAGKWENISHIISLSMGYKF